MHFETGPRRQAQVDWGHFGIIEHGGRKVATAVDQAALHGLLRRLYALGLPLISADWVVSG